MPTFELAPGQPVIFVGPMRSGKSNLIAWLLSDHSSVVVIDSKQHPDEWSSWGPRHGYVVTSDPADIRRHPKVVYQVSMPVLLDVSGWNRPGAPGSQWTEALTNCLRRGNTVVVFDELVHVLPAGRPHPVAVQILTQGGAWRLSAWGGSQYANRVETMIVRGAVHAFCFQLGPFDRKLMAEKRDAKSEVLGTLSPDPQRPTYRFGYHLTATPEWRVCERVELVMRQNAPGSADGQPGNEANVGGRSAGAGPR